MDKVYKKDPMNRDLVTIFKGDDIDEFKEGVSNMVKYYKKLLIKKDDKYYLRKGTLMYHGTTNYPFTGGSQSTGNKEATTFFGLDMEIAVWYIYEMIMNQKHYTARIIKSKITGEKLLERNGYLYVFKLKEDIPTEIIEKIYQNPKGTKVCKNKRLTCIHPQVSYRGDSFNEDVGTKIHTELTLFMETYKDSLELIRNYLIDGEKLHKNHKDIEYDVRDSMIREYDEPIKRDDKVSSEEFNRIFSVNYICEYCDFEGSLDSVLEHEKTCSFRSRGSSKKNKHNNIMNLLDFLKDKKKKKNTKKQKKKGSKVNRGKAIDPTKRQYITTGKEARRELMFKKRTERKLRKTKNVKVSGNRKDKTRPSASYYYNILKKPIGTKVRYAPHEGLGGSGKMYTYTLQIRKNGSPFWKKME